MSIEDTFPANNNAIPDETIIYYDKKENHIGIFINLIFIIAGIVIIITTSIYILGVFLILIGSLFSYKFYKNSINNDPQIILNNKGIQTSSTPYYSWGNIQNEKIIIEKEGRYGEDKLYYLAYDYPGGSEKFLIGSLDKTPEAVGNLLGLYRRRFLEKNNLR